MSAVAPLSEAEAYLVAILTDSSGIEIAEFAMVDEERPDGCMRVYPYQYVWFRSTDRFQIDMASRDVGKSFSIILRCLAFPFCFPGAQMLLTAPELSHLKPVCDDIEKAVMHIRLFREMLPNKRGNGINHQPQFQVQFANGAMILSRLPQRDGRGLKGIHSLRIEMDEAQDMPPAAFTEIIESMKHRIASSQWRIHGVSRGVSDKFTQLAQNKDPNLPFRVHRIMAMNRPSWNDEERRNKIALYGGTDEHVDYKRNVYGEMADASASLFVMHRLMQCTRINEDIWATKYNEDVYTQIKISDDLLRGSAAPIETFLQFNGAHLEKQYVSFWCGMDVGYCVDEETEIFTKRGWLHWDEVKVGDESLAIDPDTGNADWQVIESLYREKFDELPMIHMKGQSFDAFTTPHHRWLTKGESGRFRWRQTRTLTTKDCIPLRAPVPTPEHRTIPDALVELIGWYWTEGSRDSRYDGSGISIGQSLSKNPEKVALIESALREMWGEPGHMKPGPRPDLMGPLWNFNDREMPHGSKMRYFYIGKLASEHILARCPGPEKVVTMDFLLSLTADQLELFIETSKLADGWDGPSGMHMEQHSLARTKMFEAALILSGRSVSTSHSKSDKRERWHTSPLRSDHVAPVRAAAMMKRQGGTLDNGMKIEGCLYSGHIWCPTLKHHNWLARRNGSIYYTGNTRDPSEILLFGELEHPKKKGESLLRLLARIHMMRVSAADQASAVRAVFGFYGDRLRRFSMDRTGNGLPLWQELDPEAVGTHVDLRRTPEHISRRIKGYGFSNKVAVEFDDRDLQTGETAQDALIEKNVVEFATDELRKLVDTEGIELPFDQEILSEWQGQQIQYVRDDRTAAGLKTKLVGGSLHTLDAALMMIAGRNLQKIDEALRQRVDASPVLAQFY